MIRSLTGYSIGCSAMLLFSACAGPHAAQSGKPQPAEQEKQPYRKPVRMNGRGKLSSISFEEFFPLHQSSKVLVFDARARFFYDLGHIPGAIHLPPNHCDEEIHKREAQIKAALAKGQTIVTYCTSPLCPDARTVAIHLSGFGFPVSIFSGGWHAWKDAEIPTE